MKLKNFVEFYRLNNKPPFSEDKTVVLECARSEENIALLQAIRADGVDVDADPDLKDLLPDDSQIDLELQIPTNGEFFAYRTLEEMLSDAKTLLNGEYPAEFYIVADDFYSVEQQKLSSKYQNLFNLCSLIKGLGELAHYHDAKQKDGKNNNFVFIDESEIITAKPVVIKPTINLVMLEQPLLDVALIESFHSPKEKVSPTVGKEKAFFRVSIIEFLGQLKHLSQTELFVHLVMNWSEFLVSYQRNLETYLSGFAFHKARKEVSDEEFKVAEQYSKIIGDIAGKLFGLPVSFVALLGLFKSDITLIVELVVLFSVCTASWLMSSLVTNQIKQLERIDHAKGIAFDALENQKTAYPVDLQTKLTETVTALKLEHTRIKNLLIKLWYIVWSPVVIATGIMGYRYLEALINFIRVNCL